MRRNGGGGGPCTGVRGIRRGAGWQVILHPRLVLHFAAHFSTHIFFFSTVSLVLKSILPSSTWSLPSPSPSLTFSSPPPALSAARRQRDSGPVRQCQPHLNELIKLILQFVNRYARAFFTACHTVRRHLPDPLRLPSLAMTADSLESRHVTPPLTYPTEFGSSGMPRVRQGTGLWPPPMAPSGSCLHG